MKSNDGVHVFVIVKITRLKSVVSGVPKINVLSKLQPCLQVPAVRIAPLMVELCN